MKLQLIFENALNRYMDEYYEYDKHTCTSTFYSPHHGATCNLLTYDENVDCCVALLEYRKIFPLFNTHFIPYLSDIYVSEICELRAMCLAMAHAVINDSVITHVWAIKDKNTSYIYEVLRTRKEAREAFQDYGSDEIIEKVILS